LGTYVNSTNRKKINAEEVEGKPSSAVVIGGGIIGISTALQLANRGIKVTVLEQNQDISRVASYCNGAILCNSMAASWASANIIAENPGELKSIKIGWNAWLDINFYKWCFWFWFNSLVPGRSEYNHESCRQLSSFSMFCRGEEEKKYGSKVGMNRTALETLKVFHDTKEMKNFLNSSQALFWKERGYEFKPLSIEECKELEPILAGKDSRHGVINNEGVVGGVLCGKGLDSSGDVYKYTCNIARVAQNLGVDIRCNSKVGKILMTDDRVCGVELDKGEVVSGDVFILAAGVKSPELAKQVGVTLPVYPLKGYLVTVKSSDKVPMVTRNIYSPRHGLLSPLNPDKLRLSGFVEAVGFDVSIEKDKGKFLVEKLEGLLEENSLVIDTQIDVHSCLRPVSGDDVPIIGQTMIRNLFANTGHGSKGWTYSWGSAALLAQIICQEKIENIDRGRFDPRRFHPLRKMVGI